MTISNIIIVLFQLMKLLPTDYCNADAAVTVKFP